MRPKLPYGRQHIDDDDIGAVVAVLKGNWLTTGPAVTSFEGALAEATGAKEAVVVNSGTAALHLAMMALELGPGAAAVVPSITFAATANAARFVGAEVVFADVDPTTGLMTPQTLSDALARAKAQGLDVRAIIPVHYAGQVADPVGLHAVADMHGIPIVEDACHAIGGRYMTTHGAHAVGGCAHAHMACFSFHPVKTIAMGEGGALTTNDPGLAKTLRRLRNHGIERDPEAFTATDLGFDRDGEPNPWYYEVGAIAPNYRASDIACALGESQLKKLPRFVQKRRALADRYDALLHPLAPAIGPLKRVPGGEPAWHLYVVRIDFERIGLTRKAFMERLRAAGIGSQVHYIPLHQQPYYTARYGTQSLPGAEAFYGTCLSLPLFVDMDPSDVDRVVDALKSVTASVTA